MLQIMPYGLSSHFTPAEQLSFLDRCDEAGIKVVYPLAPSVAAGMRNQYDTHWSSAAWQRWVRGNISLVSNHSALLGFYICDDCCPWTLDGQLNFYFLIALPFFNQNWHTILI